MSRAFSPKVVTANALRAGDAIWFTAQSTWSGDIAQAEVLHSDEAAQARLLAAQSQQHLIAGAYLADVTMTDNGPAPSHFREAFRTRGPSNYPHGKQENATAHIS
jgi:hypothetical protein